MGDGFNLSLRCLARVALWVAAGLLLFGCPGYAVWSCGFALLTISRGTTESLLNGWVFLLATGFLLFHLFGFLTAQIFPNRQIVFQLVLATMAFVVLGT